MNSPRHGNIYDCQGKTNATIKCVGKMTVTVRKLLTEVKIEAAIMSASVIVDACFVMH